MRMDEVPFVSVVAPVRNEVRMIPALLSGLTAQSYPADRLEIVVADGMSDDGTGELLRALSAGNPGLRIVENPAGTAAAGLNAAISVTRGTVIVRMDAHTTYAPDYVVRCVEALRSSGADNVGGPWVALGRGAWGKAIAAALRSPFGVGGGRSHDPTFEGEVDTVYLGCWPRTTFERFGLFDESLVRNQDDEHNLRITRGGGVIWQSPSIRSWYTPRSSLAGLFRQYSQYGYWKVRVIRKHHLPASFRHVIPPFFVLGLGTGWLAAFVSPAVFAAYAGAVVLYAGLLIVFSAATAAKFGWGNLSRLPAVFVTYHVSYGWGFLRGILDTALARHGAGREMTRLSRGPVEGSR